MIAYGKQVLAHAGGRLSAAGVRWSSRLVETAGSPAKISEAIIAEADHWSADLIVMGTHGRRGVQRMVLGSVSEHVASKIVRPCAARSAAGGWRSAVTACLSSAWISQ